GRPQPADVGVAPDNACCRAGGVNKNAIKRLSVPPALRLRGVPGQALRRKPQPLKTATDLLQTLSIDVQAGQVNAGALQNMCRLAAGGRSGVGVAPDYAGCRAGGVNKNAIKRLSVPPALRLRGVPGQALRRKPQPLKTATDLLQTLSIDVQAGQVNAGALQNMCRLAAGG